MHSLRSFAFRQAAMSEFWSRYVRARLYGMAGSEIGKYVGFGARVYVREPRRLSVGDRCWIGPECYFENHANVTIGANVYIAARCIFATATHEIGPATRRAGESVTKPIIIGAGSWLGAGVTLLPGVRVGEGCIVGAGALVTADCDPNTLYVGVPARAVRSLDA